MLPNSHHAPPYSAIRIARTSWRAERPPRGACARIRTAPHPSRGRTGARFLASPRVRIQLIIITASILASFLTKVVNAQDSQFLFDDTGNLTAQTAESGGLPQILGQPINRVVIPGEAASFTVLAADTRGLSYQWKFNGATISGATSDAFLITNASTGNEGQYSVVLSNIAGSVTSAPAALMIDSRGSGMPDSWQLAHFGNLTQNASGDFDGDGVSNLQEFLDGTDPANAASALYRITLFNDGGTVVIAPDQPSYTNGQMVTLTAVGSGLVPFHGWTEDVDTHSNSITLTMTNNKTLFAHFLPITFQWTNSVSGDWNVAGNWMPNLVPGSNDSVVIVRSVIVTLNNNADLLDFALGDDSSAPEVTGTGTLAIRRTGAWAAGTMSGSGRTAIAPGASFTIASALPVSLSGRTLENGGTVVWSGSAYIDINGGVITNDAGATFQLLNPGSFMYGGGTPRFDNAGTFITATNGTTAFAGVAFDNYATVDFQGDTLSLSGGGTNASALRVPAGTTIIFASGTFSAGGSSSITGAGNLTVSGATANLGGVVNLSGTNLFSNGAVNLTGNYICTNNTMIISGGSTANFNGTGVVSPSVLNLSNGTLGGANTVTVGSAMSWTGGGMSGTGRTVIPPGVTLTVANPLNIFITARTLDNRGTTVWTGAGIIEMNGGVITNEAGALFQAQNPAAINYGGGSPRFDNAGTFVSAPTGTTVFNFVSFNNYNDAQIRGGILQLNGGGLNNGTMEVPAGTTLTLGFGTFNASPSSSITGAGNFTVSLDATVTLSGLLNVSGTHNFSGGIAELNGDYICTNNTMIISGGGTANFDGTGVVSPAVLNLSNGTLGGANTVTVGSAMSWTGGGMDGSGRTVIAPGVTLTVANPLNIFITSRTLDNRGTTLWSGPGIIGMDGGVITNEAGALFQVQSPASINYEGGSPRFDNAGTFVSAPTGTTTFSSVSFNNYNDAQIRGGTLQLNGGGLNHGTMEVPGGTTLSLGSGTFNASPSSSITGAGNFTVSAATATLSGLLNVSGTHTFSGGIAELNGNYICANNTMIISGGATANFDGTGVVSPAVLNLSNGTLGGANTVTVGGAMSWTGGAMSGTGRTVIPPGVTLTVANPSPINITARTLENAGTTVWSGAGSIGMNGGVITNDAGALFQLHSPAFIIYDGPSPRFDNAGTLRIIGSGKATFSSVSLNNFNVVDIQNGILAASGGYTSSSNAVLNCAIGGTTAGSNFGQLQVSGAVSLKGTLSVNLTNNFIPAVNDSFIVLTAGARNGAFENFLYPSNDVSMLLSNTTTSVILRVTDVFAVPQPFLLEPELLGSNISLSWTSVSNATYRLEFSPDLDASNWKGLPGDVTALSNTASKLDLLTSSNRYYRVRVVP